MAFKVVLDANVLYPFSDMTTAARLQEAMRSAFPEALADADAIAAIEPAMPNHPGDRHVLATAVVAGAEGIVTFNSRHFPAAALAPFGTQPISPDDFLCTLLDLDGPTVADAIAEQAGDLRRPPLTPAQLLDLLQLGRVAMFAGRLREMLELPQRTDAEILAEREGTRSSDR